MNELAAMLGEELGDCIDCLADVLGDDAAPAQVEADQQNRAVLLKRRAGVARRQLQNRRNAELGKFSIGGAFGALGKGLTAPLRVVGKVATGDFKGALRAAGDPLGLSKVARKAQHTVADVRGAIRSPLGAAARLAGGANLGGAASLLAAGHMAPIQIKCIPCDGNAAVSTDIARKVVPEMQQVRKLLDKMELSRKATSEHKRIKQQDKWRKDVIRLLHAIQEKRCK